MKHFETKTNRQNKTILTKISRADWNDLSDLWFLGWTYWTFSLAPVQIERSKQIIFIMHSDEESTWCFHRCLLRVWAASISYTLTVREGKYSEQKRSTRKEAEAERGREKWNKTTENTSTHHAHIIFWSSICQTRDKILQISWVQFKR